MQTVTDETNNATYSNVAYSPLVEQLVVKSNSTVRLCTTKSHD